MHVCLGYVSAIPQHTTFFKVNYFMDTEKNYRRGILIILLNHLMWNNIVQKANQDFEGNKQQFWSFVGRRTKCKNKTLSSLKNDAGISVSSTKG